MDYIQSGITPDFILARATCSVKPSTSEPDDVWPLITKAAYEALGKLLAEPYALYPRLSSELRAKGESLKLVFICRLRSALENHSDPEVWKEFIESACAGNAAKESALRELLASVLMHHFIFSDAEAADFYDQLCAIIPNTNPQDEIAEMFGHLFPFEAETLLNQKLKK